MDQPKVAFLDACMAVVWKPHGMATEDGNFNDLSLQSFLRNQIPQKLSWGAHPVNRLDRGTAGWVVFALKKKCFTLLSDNWHQNNHLKIYRALVEGNLPANQGQLTHFLRKNLLGKRADILTQPSAESKKAVLNYRVITQKKALELVEIQLLTGRYHQIRAQLAHIGVPIYGDVLYGGAAWKPHAFQLCAGLLQITHPTTQELLRFENWPAEFIAE
jgi:23S rRNA pseudouridine1911/1915/1917 synthase